MLPLGGLASPQLELTPQQVGVLPDPGVRVTADRPERLGEEGLELGSYKAPGVRDIVAERKGGVTDCAGVVVTESTGEGPGGVVLRSEGLAELGARAEGLA